MAGFFLGCSKKLQIFVVCHQQRSPAMGLGAATGAASREQWREQSDA